MTARRGRHVAPAHQGKPQATAHPAPPGATRSAPARAALGVVGVFAVGVALTGCVNHSPAPAATSPVIRATGSSSPATTTAAGAPSATTTSLPGMPTPTASRPSPVDSSSVTSLGSLPAAFRCPTAPSPITIPAVAPAGPRAPTPATPTPAPATPAPATPATTTPPTSPTLTSAPAPTVQTPAATPPTPAPAAVVCPSPLAGGEALYLWFAPTPELKLAALTAALRQARYVHGGPNWVAGGTVNPAMGTVGGDVYR